MDEKNRPVAVPSSAVASPAPGVGNGKLLAPEGPVSTTPHPSQDISAAERPLAGCEMTQVAAARKPCDVFQHLTISSAPDDQRHFVCDHAGFRGVPELFLQRRVVRGYEKAHAFFGFPNPL